MSITLVIQHAKRVRRIVLSSVGSLAPPYFSTLSHKRHDFRKKVTEHKMCVLIFSTTSIWNISHFKRIQRDTRTNVPRFHVKYQLVVSDFHETRIFSVDFRKIPKCKILWTSFQWEPSCSLRTDGQTDMTKPIFAYRNFVNAPKNDSKFVPILFAGYVPSLCT